MLHTITTCKEPTFQFFKEGVSGLCMCTCSGFDVAGWLRWMGVFASRKLKQEEPRGDFLSVRT